MWNDGTIRIPKDGGDVNFTYQVKHFEQGSEFGINGGRISKLIIRNSKTGEIVAHYERGWETEPEKGSEAEIAYAIILNNYN